MTLCPVDIGSAVPAAPQIAEPRPALVWLPIAALVIDDSYQRPLNKENWTLIRRIAAQFTWSHFTPLMVARLDGHGAAVWAIVDGQHRAHAAALAGHVSVPCTVVPLPLPHDQARAFAAVNGDVAVMSQYHVYRAALAAGEGWAIAARDCVAAAGCRLMTCSVSAVERKPGEVYTIGLIRARVDAGNGMAVTIALTALLRSERTRFDTVFWAAAFLRPLVDLVIERKVGAARLQRFLDAVDLSELRSWSDILYRQGHRGMSRVQIARGLLFEKFDTWKGA